MTVIWLLTAIILSDSRMEKMLDEEGACDTWQPTSEAVITG